MMKKKMNHMMATVVAVSLLSATPAWAKPSDMHAGSSSRQVQSISIKKIPSDMTKALQNLYPLLPELKDLRVTSADIWEEEDGTSEWSFSLSNKSATNEDAMVRVNLTINPDTGELLYYSTFNSSWEPTKPISDKEAKEIADKFLKKAKGDKSALYQLVKNGSANDDDEEIGVSQQRELIYQLTYNKIPVQGTDVRVRIDGDGHVTRYRSIGLGELPQASAFPDAKKAISKKQAEAAYLKFLDMQLTYTVDQQVENRRGDDLVSVGPMLKYAPSYTGAINAITGKKAYGEIDDDGWGDQSFPKETIRITPEGKEWTVKSVDDAQKLLEQAVGTDLSEAGYNESGNKETNSYRFYIDTDDGGGMSARVNVNRKTGQVQQIDYRTYDDWEGSGYKPEDAKAAAVKKLEQWLGKDVTEVELTRGWYDTAISSFEFQPLYRGIPVESSPNVVMFDGKGNITRLKLSLQNDFSALPSSDKTISADEAAKTFLKKNPLQLTYVLQGSGEDNTNRKAELYYEPAYEDEGAFVDAITGTFYRMWR